MTSVWGRDRFIRLNAHIKSDLLWWYTFIETWNGVEILQDPTQEVITIESDASGSWGCVAIWESHWLQWQCNFKAAQWRISPKELLPILLAVGVWGKQWSGKRVRCHCDNLAVVEVLNRGYSGDRELMHLLRYLLFISEKLRVSVEALHCPGKYSIKADPLSHNDLPRFVLQAPQSIDRMATRIPEQLPTLMVKEQSVWMSQR